MPAPTSAGVCASDAVRMGTPCLFMAAYSAGVRTILIPWDNKKDLDKVDSVVRENVTFVFCKTAEDVLENALLKRDATFTVPKEKKAALSDEDTITIIGGAQPQPIQRTVAPQK